MAKKNAGPGPEKGENNEILLIVGIIAVCFILWTAFHDKFAAIILAIRYGEASVIGLFTSNLDDLKVWIKHVDRKTVSVGELYEASVLTGDYIRWISAPVLVGLGVWLMRHSPTERFRRKFTDVTLPKAEADLYPWMRISTKLDFPKMDTEKGNWAMAKTERQFVRLHKLRSATGEIDREKAETVFVKQLGNLYLGYRSMKPHMRALFVLFAIRINRDFKTGDKILIQLARSASDGKIDYTGIEEVAKKNMETKKVKRVMAKHAYERTMLMSMLEEARGGPRGKDYLPPNWFLWLKGVDRPLWYALSDVGRETPHVECAGVFGHWLAEKTRGKRLEMPFVKNAAEGLALEISKFTNDDEEESDLSDEEELLEVRTAPPAPKIPTPKELEAIRAKGGK
jgi:intracellular multiplication protein IcmP